MEVSLPPKQSRGDVRIRIPAVLLKIISTMIKVLS